MPPPNTPDNTPEGSLTPRATATATLALRPFVQRQAICNTVDLQALEYEGPVEENLLCPICRSAFFDPVITSCDHAFCRKCILQAHSTNPICPIDRLPLKIASEIKAAPKIIQNQLDSLRVKCPNQTRGCDLVVARSLVENHVARYCDKTLVPCPHPLCDKEVARRDAGKGCLHYNTKCEYCKQLKQKADLETHQDKECPNRKATCKLCKVEYVRHKQEEHLKECPEAQAACKFSPLGCTQVVCRKQLEQHARVCDYRLVGPVGEQLAELRAELTALQERDSLKDRRIKFLENRSFPMPSTTSPEPIPDISLPDTSADADTAPYESRDQYFLSLFEAMESKLARLASAVSEAEGRHSVILFNETIPIKEQLTEFRSTVGVLGMHVRWLMNARIQERPRTSPSLNGMMEGVAARGYGQESDNESSPPHRTPPRL